MVSKNKKIRRNEDGHGDKKIWKPHRKKIKIAKEEDETNITEDDLEEYKEFLEFQNRKRLSKDKDDIVELSAEDEDNETQEIKKDVKKNAKKQVIEESPSKKKGSKVHKLDQGQDEIKSKKQKKEHDQGHKHK